jgi:5-methylcytosine-specific restriction endonuclease McrA
MGKMTPSQAKNAIRRALVGIVDPHPNDSQIHRIWSFFGSSCAYCERILVRGKRDAHVDHLVPSGLGGSNALSNFVLSCGICNGDEKREEDWQSFLRRKAPDVGTFKRRKKRIESWITTCSDAPVCDSGLLQTVNREADRAIVSFNAAVKRVRALKTGGV